MSVNGTEKIFLDRMEELALEKGTKIQFDYINWKGIKGHRTVVIWEIFFGSTEHHEEPQWLLKGYDENKKEVRIFAMRDMSSVVDVTI